MRAASTTKWHLTAQSDGRHTFLLIYVIIILIAILPSESSCKPSNDKYPLHRLPRCFRVDDRGNTIHKNESVNKTVYKERLLVNENTLAIPFICSKMSIGEKVIRCIHDKSRNEFTCGHVELRLCLPTDNVLYGIALSSYFMHEDAVAADKLS